MDRSDDEHLSAQLESRLAGRLHTRGPRWWRQWRTRRFDRTLGADDQSAVLRAYLRDFPTSAGPSAAPPPPNPVPGT